MKDSLFARSLAVVSATVLAVAIVVLALCMAIAERAYIGSNAEGLERAAKAAASFLPPDWANPSGTEAAVHFCARLGADSGFRVTLIDGSGKVLGDSAADPASMPNHSDRPEVAAALGGNTFWSRRQSSTTGAWMIYAAVPLRRAKGDAVSGVLRLALPLPGFLESLGNAKRIMFLAALAVALAALAGSIVLIRILDRPVVLLAERARKYANQEREAEGTGETGAAGRKPAKSVPSELKVLEESLDSMAARLVGKAAEAEALSGRFSAILDSAGEAILALDNHLRVIEANPAAYTLLGLEAGTLAGGLLPQIAGTSALVSIADRCMASGIAATANVTLYPGSEKTVHVNASPLGGAEGTGVVLAVTDISVMKRLETMRTDFVANVSHELRTPIHLIRGFAETLRSGGNDGESSNRYLEIIERNAFKMERIVKDLLSLARLERDPAQWLSMDTCDVGEIGRAAFENVANQANPRSVRLVSGIPPGLSLVANPGLVEQALTNLFENAIRYSPPDSEIRLEAEEKQGIVELRVLDRGSGIPAPDLERIFERFYRADKSRDRKSGGTGLGLAIVRHIALAHGGSVQAESWAGEGSVFTIRLPVAGSRLPPDRI